jgi:hypothetical protein
MLRMLSFEQAASSTALSTTAEERTLFMSFTVG